MRTTVTIDDTLLDKAKEYAGIEKTSEILELGLRAYIHKESSSRLAALGGSDPFAGVADRSRGHHYDFSSPPTSIVAEDAVTPPKKDS